MKMRRIPFALAAIAGLWAVATTQQASAQAAYVLPSPTNVNAEVTLYIDVSQTTDFVSNNAMNAILDAHPDDELYLWIWNPSAPVEGNGEWDNSADHQLLSKVADKLYAMTFVPAAYFGVDGPTFYANGISCLAKLKNGNAYPDEFGGEAKTEDLSVEIIPELCHGLMCVFPEIRQQDDLVTITYDNTQEIDPGLQNMGPDDCFLFLSARTDAFTLYTFGDDGIAGTAFDPADQAACKMTASLDEPGIFTFTFLPEDFFIGTASNIDQSAYAGEAINNGIRFYATRAGHVFQGPPPSNSIGLLNCE
jgi:hypothetical protein